MRELLRCLIVITLNLITEADKGEMLNAFIHKTRNFCLLIGFSDLAEVRGSSRKFAEVRAIFPSCEIDSIIL